MRRKIVPRTFNKSTPNHHTVFRTFPGANTKSLKCYIEPTLTSDKFETAVIHCGTNDIAPRPNIHQQTDEEIAEATIEIAKKCKEHGVDNVLISGIIPRRGIVVDKRRINTNTILQKMCTENGLLFIDNSNIRRHDLRYDGLHLTDTGVIDFAVNLIDAINQIPQ